MTELRISQFFALPPDEVEIKPLRSQGPGGQNVNKVASAVQLRFNIASSSLPGYYKDRLRNLRDRRITAGGVIVIKAQRFRSQEQNRDDALRRLEALLRSAVVAKKTRRATRIPRSVTVHRRETKARRGRIKALRGRVDAAAE